MICFHDFTCLFDPRAQDESVYPVQLHQLSESRYNGSNIGQTIQGYLNSSDVDADLDVCLQLWYCSGYPS